MDKILIIGSGASGVHFALSVLKKGYEVTMLDVGLKRPQVQNPADTYNQLKIDLTDPVKYFLGDRYEAVVYPGSGEDYVTKYYGFPPTKNHVFSYPQSFKYEAQGMQPLLSFAQGGLAEAWTGGAYPFNDNELSEFPFHYNEIEPYYSEVARRIGLIGVEDDLVKFYPYHENLMEPLLLDQNSQYILNNYEKHKSYLNKKYKCYLGRSRVTALSQDVANRKGCSYCGRCLWGCPSEGLYTPSITLRECFEYPNLTYIPNMLISHFEYNPDGYISSVVAETVNDHKTREFSADEYILAAGTLSSSKIFIKSIQRHTGETIKLCGLMDNRQILIPFINLQMIGESYNPDSYQYHQLAIGIETERPEEYIHGQITTLKTAMVHPIIQNEPVDLETATFIFRYVRAGLGVVNLNLPDWRRETNYVTVKVDPNSGRDKLLVNYSPIENYMELINQAVKTVKGFLWGLRCIVPPGMVQIRPMGASVHYSGTIPMSALKKPYTVTKNCQSNDFTNLFIVDGTTMPFLPAKNVTFTLMANAVRVAESAF
jgi:choline dehydrogenase-like flavoprotein